MSETLASDAIGRIERALARVEAALQDRPARTRDTVSAELVARHRALREETSQALADLNQVIARAGGRG
jgi:hypothetical protein